MIKGRKSRPPERRNLSSSKIEFDLWNGLNKCLEELLRNYKKNGSPKEGLLLMLKSEFENATEVALCRVLHHLPVY